MYISHTMICSHQLRALWKPSTIHWERVASFKGDRSKLPLMLQKQALQKCLWMSRASLALNCQKHIVSSHQHIIGYFYSFHKLIWDVEIANHSVIKYEIISTTTPHYIFSSGIAFSFCKLYPLPLHNRHATNRWIAIFMVLYHFIYFFRDFVFVFAL